MQRDWGGHRPSPVGTANNATEFQCSIPGCTPKWPNFQIHTPWEDLSIKKPRGIQKLAQGKTGQAEPLLQQTRQRTP